MPAWTETLCLVALLVVLASLHLLGLADAGTVAERSLLTGPVSTCQVVWEQTAYGLDLERGRLTDTSYQPVARLDASLAANIHKALQEARLLRRIPEAAHHRAADYGLDQPLLWASPAHGKLALGTGADGSGWARFGQDPDVWQLDRDLANLLRQHPEQLRARNLGLPARCTRIDSGQWQLRLQQGRWWLQQNQAQLWCQADAIQQWLAKLASRHATAFPLQTTTALPQQLQISGEDSRGQTIRIELRYAEASDRDLVLRQQAGLNELLVLDGPVALQPERFRPQCLCPIPLAQADRIRLGQLELRRQQGRWQGSRPDMDQEQVQALLAQLQTLPAPADAWPRRQAAASGSDWEVWIDDEHWRAPAGVTGIAAISEAQLVDQQVVLLPADTTITAVVVTPASGTPRMHERRADDTWDQDHQALEGFIQALRQARVSAWQSSLQSAPADIGWDSTITLAYEQGSVSLKLHRSGRIGHVERDLLGMLDEASRAAVLGE